MSIMDRFVIILISLTMGSSSVAQDKNVTLMHLLLYEDYAKYEYFAQPNRTIDFSYFLDDTSYCNWSNICQTKVEYDLNGRIQKISRSREVISTHYYKDSVVSKTTGLNANTKVYYLSNGIPNKGLIIFPHDSIPVKIFVKEIDSTQVILTIIGIKNSAYWQYNIFFSENKPVMVVRKLDWSDYSVIFSIQANNLTEILDFGCGIRKNVFYSNLIKNNDGSWKRKEMEFGVYTISNELLGFLKMSP